METQSTSQSEVESDFQAEAQENQNNQPQQTVEVKSEINIKKIFIISWSTFKANAKSLLFIMLVYVGIRIFQALLQGMADENSVTKALLAIFFAIINIIIGIGVVQVFLKISRGVKVKTREIIGDRRYFWRFVGGSLLYGLIVLLGYLLLIIPGIIWQYKYGLFSYLIIDKDMGPMQALKESGRLMYGYKWKLFLMQLFMIAVIIAGLLLLGVGVLVSFIIISLMSVYFYRILIGEKVFTE